MLVELQFEQTKFENELENSVKLQITLIFIILSAYDK